MRKDFKLKALLAGYQSPVGVEDYIRCLLLAGFSREQAYEEITREAHRAGMDFMLGEQLDVVDETYKDWRGKTQRILRGKHTDEEWEDKKRQYDFRCVYCGRKMKRLTKDHIVPVRLGGNNFIDNIIPACMSCNRRKGTKAIERFKNGAMLKLL